MDNKYILKNVSDIKAISTNHGIGLKKVFTNGEKCKSGLTQAAFGFFKKGEKVEEHIHPTMEEFYFFESGKSTFYIGEDILSCKKGDFVMVPANVNHFIEANTDIKFIYWGIRI